MKIPKSLILFCLFWIVVGGSISLSILGFISNMPIIYGIPKFDLASIQGWLQCAFALGVVILLLAYLAKWDQKWWNKENFIPVKRLHEVENLLKRQRDQALAEVTRLRNELAKHNQTESKVQL